MQKYLLTLFFLCTYTHSSDIPSPSNPFKIKCANISNGLNDRSEFYSVQLYDLEKGSNRPAITALVHNGHTQRPTLLLPPYHRKWKKEKYLAAIINQLPEIQKDAGKSFNSVILCVNQRDRHTLKCLSGTSLYEIHPNDMVSFNITFPLKPKQEIIQHHLFFEFPKNKLYTKDL